MRVPDIVQGGDILGRHTLDTGFYGWAEEQVRYQQRRAYGNTFGTQVDHVAIATGDYVWESTTSRGVGPTPIDQWFGHVRESRGEWVVILRPRISEAECGAMLANIRSYRGAKYGYFDIARLWSIYGKPSWLRRIAWWLAYYTHPSTERSQICSELIVRGLAVTGLPVPRLWGTLPDLVSPARLLHWGWQSDWIPVVWTSDKCPYTRWMKSGIRYHRIGYERGKTNILPKHLHPRPPFVTLNLGGDRRG